MPVISGGNFTEYDRHALKSGETTSILEVTAPENEIEVFPNPATSFVFLTSEEDQSGWSEWKIYNIAGQVVAHSRAREFPDVTGLPDGIYSISIRANSSVVMKKLVVQH